MDFFSLAIIVASLAWADVVSRTPATGLAWRLPLIVALTLAPPACAWLLVRLATRQMRQGEYSPLLTARIYRWQSWHAWLVLAAAAGVAAAGWPQIVAGNCHLADVPLIYGLAVLAPYLAMNVASAAAWYGLRAVDLQRDPALSRSLAAHLQRQFRLGWGLPLILGLTPQTAAASVRVAGGSAEMIDLAALAALLGLLAMFPLVAVQMWNAPPLPPGERCTLLTAAIAAWRVRISGIRLWKLGPDAANAAVLGVVPWLRYVVVSDSLMTQLSPAELLGVLGHEAGHIRRRHMLSRLIVITAPCGWCAAILACLPLPAPTWLGGEAFQVLTETVITLAVLGVCFLAIGRHYLRQTEHEADLDGCRLASWSPAVAADDAWSRPLDFAGGTAFTAALEKVARLNGIPRDARGMQHDSIERRIEFVQNAVLEPSQETVLRTRLRTIHRAAAAVALGGLGCWLWVTLAA